MKSALSEIKSASCLDAALNSILSSIDEYDISELIVPDGEKDFYFECAHIISNLPSRIVALHATELLTWFQDLNWPGVEQIYKSLRNLPADVLGNALQKAYQTATEEADEEWMYNLRERFPDVPLNKCL